MTFSCAGRVGFSRFLGSWQSLECAVPWRLFTGKTDPARVQRTWRPRQVEKFEALLTLACRCRSALIFLSEVRIPCRKYVTTLRIDYCRISSIGGDDGYHSAHGPLYHRSQVRRHSDAGREPGQVVSPRRR